MLRPSNIGFTKRLTGRIREHNHGQSKSTCNKGPWKLIGYLKSEVCLEAMEIGQGGNSKALNGKTVCIII